MPPQPQFNGKLLKNRRRQGEIFQIRFALDAMDHDYICAAPYTDESFDLFAMPRDFARRVAQGRNAEDKRLPRIALAPVALVQVRSTSTAKMAPGGVTPFYRVTTKHTFGGKVYADGEIDIFAAYISPLRTWYIIPFGEVGRATSISLFPHGAESAGKYEKFRERWTCWRFDIRLRVASASRLRQRGCASRVPFPAFRFASLRSASAPCRATVLPSLRDCTKLKG